MFSAVEHKKFLLPSPTLLPYGSQIDVVYLGWPIEPSYMSPTMGGGGRLRGLRQWEQLCTWTANKLWRSISIFNLCCIYCGCEIYIKLAKPYRCHTLQRQPSNWFFAVRFLQVWRLKSLSPTFKPQARHPTQWRCGRTKPWHQRRRPQSWRGEPGSTFSSSVVRLPFNW
jgi:hypothetical protein